MISLKSMDRRDKVFLPVVLAAAAGSILFPALITGVLASLLIFQLIRDRCSRYNSPLPLKLLLWGFFIRLPIITLLAVYSYLTGKEATIFGDSRLVLRVSSFAAQAFFGNFGPIQNSHLQPGFYGYSLINWAFGAIHFLFGYSPFLVMLVNVLAILLAGWLVFLITYRLTGRTDISSLALGLTVFMPSQIMWSINLLKEPLITLSLTFILYLFVEMIALRRWWYLLPIILLCLPLGHMRSQTHYLAFLTVGLASLLFIPRRTWPGIVIMAAGALAIALKLGPSRIEQIYRQTQASIVGYQNGFISTGGAIYVVIPHRLTYAGSGGGPMTLPETLETYLKSLFYYLTSPNLLSNLSLTKIAAAPQMIVWLGLLVFCFLPGVMYLLRFRLRLSGILIIYLFIFTSAMALYTGNEGAAFRQRDALTPIFFIPMSIGFFNFTGWLSRHIKAATQKRMDGIKSGNTPAGIKNSPEIY